MNSTIQLASTTIQPTTTFSGIGGFLPNNTFLSQVEQCGANDPGYKERCGPNSSPPTCAEDEACRTTDNCTYNCVKQSSCEYKLFNSILENGKLLCNCAEEPPVKYSWACEYDEDQHGYAIVPDINRAYDFDDRRVTLLGKSDFEKYNDLLGREEIFDDFFQKSPCQGTSNVTDESVHFSDIFNNESCIPKCETRQNGTKLYEDCSVVIGYDDLIVPTGENQAVLQRGNSWMLTCSRTLDGEAEGSAEVIDDGPSGVTARTEIDTEFNLDIHCCDPADTECSDDCTSTPAFKIGPYDNLENKRFYVKMDFEFGNKALEARGFLHVDSCTFQEFGRNNEALSEPIELLQDGCPIQFDGLSLLENMRNRTLELSHQETMDLIPFRINSEALSFNLTCKMLNCPWDAIDNDLCKLKDQCFLGDRYDPFSSMNSLANNVSPRSGRRHISPPVQSESITVTLNHPCALIHKEGDGYCIGDNETLDRERDCWTFELCEQRPRSDDEQEPQESSGSFATLSALFLVFLL